MTATFRARPIARLPSRSDHAQRARCTAPDCGRAASAGQAGGEIRGAYGTAFLRETTRPLVLVAGGSGLAPMKSMLLCSARRGLRLSDSSVHGVREARDLYDVEVTEELERRHGLRTLPLYSQVAPETSSVGPVSCMKAQDSNARGALVALREGMELAVTVALPDSRHPRIAAFSGASRANPPSMGRGRRGRGRAADVRSLRSPLLGMLVAPR